MSLEKINIVFLDEHVKKLKIKRIKVLQDINKYDHVSKEENYKQKKFVKNK